MKDNLFNLLLNLFEQTVSQMQKTSQSPDEDLAALMVEEDISLSEPAYQFVKPALSSSMRIWTYEEQIKLTKASYQLLARLRLWNVLDEEQFEHILHQLQFSDSRIVNLQETKWTVRNVLASNLNEKQLSFLDLVLYQKEDELSVQ